VGDTVGSLSEEQHSVILGSVLGDGAMRCKTNALMEINHSANQESYVRWKYQRLANLVRTEPSIRAGNGGRIACRFVTRSLPELTPYYREFYHGGRKSISTVPVLTPLALAVWLMDDGCASRTSVYLNTQQFDLYSQHRLIEALRRQFGIHATLNRDKSYFRIRVSVQGTRILSVLVRPLMLPELRYKLPQVTP
jgi:LAGLIDADG DNA endonuclease family protein